MSRAARVIVATYNQLALFRKALRGYLRQTTTDFALTIADDGSSDGTKAYIEEIRPAFEAKGIPFAYVWQRDDGFRKTRILNEAVREAEDEPLLVFSDGDCVPPASFVAKHIDVHEPWSFHVGGCYRLSREDSEALTEADIDAGRHETLGTAEHEKDLRKRRRKSHWGVRFRRKNRPKILGLNFAADRQLFDSLNGFDERFTSWGIGEDSDLRDRAMRHRPRARVKNLYLENDVYHLWHPVGEGGGRKKQWDYYKSPRPVRCERGLVDESQ
ncbi:MAG: glycosyltransferase [Planctomycetota bacterium]|nr:glycosyltransferase [Planctomycetota bacterium]